ncbi:MAG: hypothetical protein GKR89_05590 [Candidatus Latescibacteria bacterium]|nr:hypothetical protein [Candidatus Latescibacterota bacterium]
MKSFARAAIAPVEEIMFVICLLLTGVLGVVSSNAAERLVIGGSGLSWSDNSLIFTALEELDGTLAPLEADTTENLMPRVRELGGEATTSVTTASARSNRILTQLTDGDFRTGWRVYTNTNGAELELDMGAVFILQRIRLLCGVFVNGECSAERGLRGYELYVNDGDSLNFSNGLPVYSLIAQDRSHGEPQFDIDIAPQAVRFLKLRSTGERSFQMGDMEIFGAGVTPFARYTSEVIDLGGPANFGPLTVHMSTFDEKADILFSTKTGIVENDSLFFGQTGIPGEFEEVPENQFDRTLDPSYAGIVEENTRDWSAWSPPYAKDANKAIEGAVNSPDNRRFVQFDVRFISNGLTDKVVIDSLTLDYTVPAIADSVVAEIDPPLAEIGGVNSFSYHLRSVFSRDNRGFDTVIIATPFQGEISAVEIDGQTVDFSEEVSRNELKISFPDDRVEQSGQTVTVRFDNLMTVSGTEFRGWVDDSQSDTFPQRVVGGDADEEVDSNTLIVGGHIESRLFTEVNFSAPVITPNGDGRNDEMRLNYILLKATDEVQVAVTVYDLGGRVVRRLYDQRDLSGPNAVSWDGRDDQDSLVPPGIYVIRLVADTDGGETAQVRPIAVAY